jgi:hypothetical protein
MALEKAGSRQTTMPLTVTKSVSPSAENRTLSEAVKSAAGLLEGGLPWRLHSPAKDGGWGRGVVCESVGELVDVLTNGGGGGGGVDGLLGGKAGGGREGLGLLGGGVRVCGGERGEEEGGEGSGGDGRDGEEKGVEGADNPCGGVWLLQQHVEIPDELSDLKGFEIRLPVLAVGSLKV